MQNQALKMKKQVFFYFAALLITISLVFLGSVELFAQSPTKKRDTASSGNVGQAASQPSPAAQGSNASGAEEKDDEDEKEDKEQSAKDEIKKELTEPAPVLEIKRLESEKPLYSIELRNVELADLFRVIAHDYNLNIMVESGVQGTITASFTNISLEECLESIAEMSNLILEKKGNILRVSQNLITRIFVMKYIEAKKFIAATNAILEANKSNVVSTATATAGQTTQGGTAAAAAVKQESTIYDLLSDKGKMLLGQQPNSIVVIDYPRNIAHIEAYLNTVDKKMTTKVFKLKYLKMEDVLGVSAATQSQSTATTSSSGSSSASASGSSTTTH